MGARAGGFVLMLAVAAPLASARAAEAFSLAWDGPAECQMGEALQRRVTRLASVGEDSEGLRARVTVRRRGEATFRMVLETSYDGREGERVLEGSSCGEVTEAAAVVLALALDPEGALARLAEAEVETNADADASQPDPAPTSVTPEEEEKPAAQTPGVPLSPFIDLSLLAGTGQLPDAAVGGRGAVGLAFAHWIVALGGNYFPSRSNPLVASSGEVHFERWEAELDGCALWPRLSPWMLAGCGHLSYATLLGKSQNIASPGTSRNSWFGLGASLQAGRTMSDAASLFTQLHLSRALHQERFFIEGLGEIYETDPWALRIGLGVRWTP